MKRIAWIAVLAVALLVAAPTFAGEGSCDHDAQVCLNYLAENLQGKGWAGVEMDEGHGTATVTKVYENTPAARAGVKVGDALVAINGIRLGDEANKEKLMAMWGEMKPGKSFDYTLARSGKEKEISITLAEMPQDQITRVVGQHMLQGHTAVEVADAGH